MKQIFMDANGWSSLNSRNDQLHELAVKTNKKLLKDGYRYVTTNFVLDETYTGLLTKVGHFAAIDFGERIRKSQKVLIVHVSADIEEEAWRQFSLYSDKEFSFTDCTSFVVMKQFCLLDAFTNDHHFEQIGFNALLKK